MQLIRVQLWVAVLSDLLHRVCGSQQLTVKKKQKGLDHCIICFYVNRVVNCWFNINPL